MKHILPAAVAVLGALLTSCATPRQAKPITFRVGDVPPPLAGTNWIKGEPVTSFEPGKIYIIECWATWCGPCVEAIPHVTKIQADYAKDGVIVIGQNVWEDDPSKTEPFVKKMDKKMEYRVVLDDMSAGEPGKMAATWLEAAGEYGIPCSFLIGRDGKLVWVGHPMGLEPVLKRVIAGTFDPQQLAAEQLVVEQFQQDVQSALGHRQWDKALTMLEDFAKREPESPLLEHFDRMRFDVLLEKQDYDAAYRIGAKLAVQFQDEAGALNNVAWTIVDKPGLAKRDLDLAEKMAVRAVELTQRDDANIIDTLARVHFEKGRLAQAIELETEAVGKAEGKQKKDFQVTLDRYKKAKSPTR